jgi:phosphomannomutase
VYFSAGQSIEGEVAIRLFDSSGCEFNESNLQSVNEIFHEDKIRRVSSRHIGNISNIDHASEIYTKAIPQLINKSLLAGKDLKIVLDCSHGPSGVVSPALLNDLQTTVIALNTFIQTSDKVFPNIHSIKSAVSIVQASNANLGVVVDADGSRALFIDDQGNIISFSELMMLFMSELSPLKISKSNPIVVSSTASKIIDTYANQMGYKVKRVENKPGAISRTIREEHSSFGAADTFKFYFSQYGPFSDATFTMLMILQIVANSNEPLSSVLRSFPRNIRTSKTLMLKADPQVSMTEIREKLRDLNYSVEDMIIGVKIIKPGKWVTVNQSIYQNALILTCESEEPEGAKEMIAEIEEFIKKTLKL